MEIVKKKLSDLRLDPLNLRAHGNENIEMIKKSLVSYSQYKPLIVDAKTNIVKIGNGRFQAMKELGWKEADCILVDFDSHEGMEVIDNRLNELSEWKDESLDDWLLNSKGIDWWGVDSAKAVDLFQLEKKRNRPKSDKPKKEKEIPVCPCCGKPLKKKKINLL